MCGDNHASLRVNPRAKIKNKVGMEATPMNMILNQSIFAGMETSSQRVAYPLDQIAIASSRNPNATEPGADRRQAIVAATNVITAERIERMA